LLQIISRKIRRCSSVLAILLAAVEAMNFGLKYKVGRNYFLKQVRGKIMKQTHGVYPAPLKIIDVCSLFLGLLAKFVIGCFLFNLA